jgi:hypothetical protein
MQSVPAVLVLSEPTFLYPFWAKKCRFRLKLESFMHKEGHYIVFKKVAKFFSPKIGQDGR